ncbi:hypothetical protein [Leptodesmis sp.]|uniref:hypothetical protein n=1 Tax=Leptodesmis sp. TaxID=3100501 RepID=UPI0040535342
MKTLIITVGTRQVGWPCRDGIVRSLGADSDRGHPPHIDELYAELGLARGYHSDEPKPEFGYSVRHLGEVLYQKCQAAQDFSPVELLLDGVILADQVPKGLNRIILWGTNQPEGTPWNFRRGDTLWLAHLMAGKIRQQYPTIKVDVWQPEIAVNQTDQIRQHLEQFLVELVKDSWTSESDEALTLQIQTKGSVPQVANTLEIAAAALMRQCIVQQVIPIEPSPLFEDGNGGKRSVRSATEFNLVSLGQYFWPVERERICSAWEQGDFGEAKVWLAGYRDRRKALYQLAERLALAANWQLQDALKQLQGAQWLDAPPTKREVPKRLRSQWRAAIQERCKTNETPKSKFLKIWEETFLIWLELKRQNVSLAFFYFSRTLERLLYLRCKIEDWIKQGWLTPPEDKRNWGSNYKASFGELWRAFQKMKNLNDDARLVEQFKAINELRNKQVHSSHPLTLTDITEKLFPESSNSDWKITYKALEQLLQSVCSDDWTIPEEPLLQSLYQWGLDSLNQT